MTRQWWAGDPARHRLADQVQHLAPDAHVIRVRPDGSVTCYRADRTEITGRDQAHDQRIAQLLRAYYQGVNWVAHDFYPADATLRAAPLPGRRGSDPAADGTFGSGLGPLYAHGAEIS